MVGCGTNIPDKTQHPAHSVSPLTYEEHYGFTIDDDTANTYFGHVFLLPGTSDTCAVTSLPRLV